VQRGITYTTCDEGEQQFADTAHVLARIHYERMLGTFAFLCSAGAWSAGFCLRFLSKWQWRDAWWHPISISAGLQRGAAFSPWRRRDVAVMHVALTQ
jgi:hypothetical protein